MIMGFEASGCLTRVNRRSAARIVAGLHNTPTLVNDGDAGRGKREEGEEQVDDPHRFPLPAYRFPPPRPYRQ